jgi:hypothetical protein
VEEFEASFFSLITYKENWGERGDEKKRKSHKREEDRDGRREGREEKREILFYCSNFMGGWFK